MSAIGSRPAPLPPSAGPVSTEGAGAATTTAGTGEVGATAEAAPQGPVDGFTEGGAPAGPVGTSGPPPSTSGPNALQEGANYWNSYSSQDPPPANSVDAQKAMKQLGDQAEALAKQMDGLKVVLAESLKKLEKPKSEVAALKAQLNGITGDSDDANKARANLERQINEKEGTIERMEGGIAKIAGDIVKLRDGMEDLKGAMDNVIEQTQRQMNNEQLTQEQRDTAKALNEKAKQVKTQAQEGAGKCTDALGALPPAMLQALLTGAKKAGGAKPNAAISGGAAT